MGNPARVVHYLNQFFGGIGGEEVADSPVVVRSGPVGSGRALQMALGDAGAIVATVIGGDNFVNERPDEAAAAIAVALRELAPNVVVAGPAFESGRYGLACGLVCKAAQTAGVPAVAGMHASNPGVAVHRKEVLIARTSANVVDLPSAMATLARLGLKLARGEELGPAQAEGYVPRGIRKPGLRAQPGYLRALDMLVARLSGQDVMTELPIEMPERVTPAAPIADLRRAAIALITTGGLVRKGNPDRQVSKNPTRYYRHNVAELEALSGKDWEAYHNGYFNTVVNSNPNYILPLSFAREFEAEGRIGSVHPWIYALPGIGTPVARAKQFGLTIASELKDAKVDGALLVAT